MKKLITNSCLLICTAVVLILIPLFLSHDSPIPVDIVELDAAQLSAQKEAAAQAAKESAKQALIKRIYTCQMDEDCVIVEKDPCGCAVGPKGVVAINMNYIADFHRLNGTSMVTQACADTLSQERECSPAAHGVCQAHTCKIAY